jgi:hypothetical protein
MTRMISALNPYRRATGSCLPFPPCHLSPSLFRASVVTTKPSLLSRRRRQQSHLLASRKNPAMGYFPTLLLFLLLFTMGRSEINGTTTVLLPRFFKGIIGEARNSGCPAWTYESVKERLEQSCSLPPF